MISLATSWVQYYPPPCSERSGVRPRRGPMTLWAIFKHVFEKDSDAAEIESR